MTMMMKMGATSWSLPRIKVILFSHFKSLYKLYESETCELSNMNQVKKFKHIFSYSGITWLLTPTTTREASMPTAVLTTRTEVQPKEGFFCSHTHFWFLNLLPGCSQPQNCLCVAASTMKLVCKKKT